MRSAYRIFNERKHDVVESSYVFCEDIIPGSQGGTYIGEIDNDDRLTLIGYRQPSGVHHRRGQDGAIEPLDAVSDKERIGKNDGSIKSDSRLRRGRSTQTDTSPT